MTYLELSCLVFSSVALDDTMLFHSILVYIDFLFSFPIIWSGVARLYQNMAPTDANHITITLVGAKT